MRIGVYHQHRDDVLGGAEYFVVVAAEILSEYHDVQIVHHKQGLAADQLNRHYGTNLHQRQLVYVAPDLQEASFHQPWRRFSTERAKYAQISAGYDLWIASVHDVPPFCHAKRGALFVHFPLFDRDSSYPWCDDGGSPRMRIRRMYARWEWDRRFRGYSTVLTNSEFSRRYTERWWGLNATVIYAPAETRIEMQAQKQNKILSVGRFTSGGTNKRQLEMMAAYAQLNLEHWKYVSLGGLSASTEDQRYFGMVRQAAMSAGAEVVANADHQQLRSHYASASIFWHAAGFGETDHNPRLMEHFGIVTVEAMAAGCVPVVIDRGGQPEIVQHGVNGYLWRTMDEILAITRHLTRNPDLVVTMSQAARSRADHFSREAFRHRLLAALEGAGLPPTCR